MYKLLWLLLIILSGTILQAQQFDEEVSLSALFQLKHAVNRATHAAALQVDAQQLSQGILAIDEVKAKTTFYRYLYANLHLDERGVPQSNTFWKNGVERIQIVIINANQHFPYVFYDAARSYRVTLNEPGVIAFVDVTYPAMFNLLEPIHWQMNGAAALVH